MTELLTKDQAKRKYAHVKNPCRFVSNHDLGMAYRGSCISSRNTKRKYDGSNACPCDFSEGRFDDDVARARCKFHMNYLTESTTISDMVYEKEQQRKREERWDNRFDMLDLSKIGLKIKDWIMNSGIKWKIVTLLSIVLGIWFNFFSSSADTSFFNKVFGVLFFVLTFQLVFVFWFVFDAIFKFIKKVINFIRGK